LGPLVFGVAPLGFDPDPGALADEPLAEEPLVPLVPVGFVPLVPPVRVVPGLVPAVPPLGLVAPDPEGVPPLGAG
jgi:hypothetical protein